MAVLIDEAYVEFVTDPGAVRGLDFAERENVVLLRTFSKAYGLAGFRVGYAVAAPELAAAARAVALPFGVSTPAQAAVLAALDAEAEMWDRVRRDHPRPGRPGRRAARPGLRRARQPGQLRLVAGPTTTPSRTPPRSRPRG